MNTTTIRDTQEIYAELSNEEKDKLNGSTIVLTGGAGFLGYSFLSFFGRYKETLKIKNIICLDNFKNGCPRWLEELREEGLVSVRNFNVISDSLETVTGIKDAAYVFHMASIASPTFYRKLPIETLDANVSGLRKLLDFYKGTDLKKLVFFSSSEIYGDPDGAHIPTSESYRGYVDCQGPRACYDESKRFGETLCYLYNKQYGLPATVIRPFNNYGPGMRLDDARVPADFAKAVMSGSNIHILSDGKPSRTFCYVSDAIAGYIKAALYDSDRLETFNIGMDRPEVSIRQLAEVYADAAEELFGYHLNVVFSSSEEAEYLTNNPSRRCPDISRARRLLQFDPKVTVEEGVRRYLQYCKECRDEELL